MHDVRQEGKCQVPPDYQYTTVLVFARAWCIVVLIYSAVLKDFRVTNVIYRYRTVLVPYYSILNILLKFVDLDIFSCGCGCEWHSSRSVFVSPRSYAPPSTPKHTHTSLLLGHCLFFRILVLNTYCCAIVAR